MHDIKRIQESHSLWGGKRGWAGGYHCRCICIHWVLHTRTSDKKTVRYIRRRILVSENGRAGSSQGSFLHGNIKKAIKNYQHQNKNCVRTLKSSQRLTATEWTLRQRHLESGTRGQTCRTEPFPWGPWRCLRAESIRMEVGSRVILLVFENWVLCVQRPPPTHMHIWSRNLKGAVLLLLWNKNTTINHEKTAETILTRYCN